MMTLAEKLTLLPEVCASRLPSTGEPILIERGSVGYYPTSLDPDEFNTENGITPQQVLAMEIGSMFGWDAPGANPNEHPAEKDFGYNRRVK